MSIDNIVNQKLMSDIGGVSPVDDVQQIDQHQQYKQEQKEVQPIANYSKYKGRISDYMA